MAFEEANDAVASEQRIFSEIQDYKVTACRNESVYTYIWGSRYVWWQKTKVHSR